MRSVWIAILCASVAFAAPQLPKLNRASHLSRGVVFRMLPAGGGAPIATDPCAFERAAGNLVGNYLCLQGGLPDGGWGQISSAAATLSANGSPTPQMQRECGNGPNCGNLGAQRLSSGNYFSTATLSQTTDITVCAGFKADAPGAAQMALIDENNGSPFSFYIASGAPPVLGMGVAKAGGGTSGYGGGTIYAGAYHVGCATYHFVADGTSVGFVYLDGVQTSTTSTLPGPLNSASAIITVGSIFSSSAPLVGRLYWALKTDAVLSAAQVTALTNVAKGAAGPQGISGSLGEAISETATGLRTISADDGSITVLPPGVVGVSLGGIQSLPQTVNLLQYGDAVGTSTPWVADTSTCAAPTVTLNSADLLAPKGTYSATKLVFPSCSSTSRTGVYQLYTGTAAAYSTSVYARTLSGTYSFNLSDSIASTFAGGSSVVCTANSTSWTRCQLPNITNTAVSWDAYLGYNGLQAGETAISAGTVYVVGAQEELGAAVSQYCPTLGATNTCGPSIAQMAAATPNLSTSFCASVDASSSWASGTVGIIGGGVWGTANSWALYWNSGVVLTFAAYDATPTIKFWNSSWSPVAGSLHHLRFCYDGAGDTPLVFADGVPLAPGVNGTGTGVIANQNGVLSIADSVNSSPLIGIGSNFCVGNCSPGPAGIAACGACP